MTEIIFDVALPPIDWTGVPPQVRFKYQGRVSAVITSEAGAHDLVRYLRNANFAPLAPVLLYYPGEMPAVIEGKGYAPAAELQDLAIGWFAKTDARVKARKPLFDFDALREKHGLPERSVVDEQTREALWNTAKDLQRRQRTARVSGELLDEHPEFERSSFPVDGIRDDD